MADRVGAVVVEGRTDPMPGGLEDLYVRHAGAAVRLAFLLTGDPELAQDLAQDAFVRVAGRFRHLRQPDAFEPYLRRAVINLCASHYRRSRVARAYVERQRHAPEPLIDPPDIGTRDHLRGVLRELPMRQRAAVVLRYYDDLPEQEVAATLGCSSRPLARWSRVRCTPSALASEVMTHERPGTGADRHAR
jgi:RNA polymerase sigma factor (sigma-70 family)